MLIGMAYKIYSGSKSMNKDETCRLSIVSATQLSKLKQGSYGFVDLVNNIECEKKEFYVDKKHVMRSGRISDKLVKDMVALEMANCWNKVGKGKLDPFKDSWTVDDTFCLVCSKIVYTDSFLKQAKKENYELKGFQYHMAKRKLPAYKKTVAEFLGGNSVNAEQLAQIKTTESDPKFQLSLDNDYVVVWRTEKYEAGFWEKVVTAVVTAAVGAVLISTGILFLAAAAALGAGGTAYFQGDTQIQQQIFLVPERQIAEEFNFGTPQEPIKKDFCTKLLN